MSWNGFSSESRSRGDKETIPERQSSETKEINSIVRSGAGRHVEEGWNASLLEMAVVLPDEDLTQHWRSAGLKGG